MFVELGQRHWALSDLSRKVWRRTSRSITGKEITEENGVLLTFQDLGSRGQR